jgi:tetratricopeptide (TPR) repeat protein
MQDPRSTAEELIARGKSLIANDLPEATRLLNEAVRLFWAIGDQYRAAAEIGNYGWALRRLGRPEHARTYLLNAADLFKQMGLLEFEQRHRAAASEEDQPTITRELLESLPPAVRGALERGDLPALQFAIDSLPLAEQPIVFERLVQAGVISEPAGDAEEALEQFAPLLADIAAVARGEPIDRTEIELALGDLERKGWQLRKPVMQIWQGERRLARLINGLDEIDRRLVERIIDLINPR